MDISPKKVDCIDKEAASINKWIFDFGDDTRFETYECPNCGAMFDSDLFYDVADNIFFDATGLNEEVVYKPYKYCPYCGARNEAGDDIHETQEYKSWQEQMERELDEE